MKQKTKMWFEELNKNFSGVEYNRHLCNRFPFLIPVDFFQTDEKRYIEIGYNYDYTWLDYVDIGWKTIFLEMCEEIQQVLEFEDIEFKILDIKEKYGEMRVYYAGGNDKIQSIISNYTDMSKYICIECGAPAKYILSYWYRPYCKNCAPENVTNDDLIEV